MKVEFVKPVYSISEIPKERLPEIVLCGRSNVGKSSFLNTISDRKSIAKVSSTPGKTKSVNYFLVEDKFYLVDLPGFGYAKASKTEIERWMKLIEDYFLHSGFIALAVHLIDSRHETTPLDIELQEMLDHYEVASRAVFTKVDKITQTIRGQRVKNFKELSIHYQLLQGYNFFSSTTGEGKKEMTSELLQVAGRFLAES